MSNISKIRLMTLALSNGLKIMKNGLMETVVEACLNIRVKVGS